MKRRLRAKNGVILVAFISLFLLKVLSERFLAFDSGLL
jgi:hypothetical protein